MNKYFFGWGNVKKLIIEFLMTLSNKDSLWSSKRLERFALFASALTLTIAFCIYNRDKLTSTDFLIIVAPLFGYAGFNTTMLAKEKKEENISNDEIK